MRLSLAAALLIAAAVLCVEGPAAAQQAYCPYGQTCQGTNPVPFPVINPGQAIGNVITYPLRRNQTAAPLTPPPGAAPIAIPPPVLPPGR